MPAFAATLGILFPVVAEVLAIRLTVHQKLGENAFVLGAYARDVYVPLALGALYLLVKLQRSGKLRPRINRPSVAINLLAFPLTLAWCRFSIAAPAIYVSVLLALILVSLFSALLLFVAPGELRELRGRALFVLAGTELLLLYPRFVVASWNWLAVITGNCVALTLRALGVPVSYWMERGSLRIWTPEFAASINSTCAGWEGLFFFLLALSVRFAVADARESRAQVAWLIPFGCALIFATNIFRICAFFIFALFLETHWPAWSGRQLFESAFHGNAGWLLYALVIWWLLRDGKPASGKKLRSPRRFSHVVILLGMLWTLGAQAETGCAGTTYPFDPTCGGACALTKCQDVSFGQDGSSYQCCPPDAATPELPDSRLALALPLLLGFLAAWRSRISQGLYRVSRCWR